MSNLGWRKQGGISNFMSQNSISVNSLSCDIFTLRQAYFGNFDIRGELRVSGNATIEKDVTANNLSITNNIVCNNLTVNNDTQNLGNMSVTKNFTVSTGNIYVVNGNVDLSQNLFLRKRLYLGNSNAAYLVGTDTVGNIGINTATPVATLDVQSSSQSFVLNVASQLSTAFTALSRTNANHCSVVYSDASSARIDMFVDTAFINAATVPDCRIQYSLGGNLVIDVSNNTDILSNVVISPDATRTVHKYGETLMVYGSSASSSLYQPYFYETAPGNIGRAEAITAVSSVNNGLSFINLVNQGDTVASNTGNTFGLSMGGGLYPWDTTRTMGTLGLIRPSATQSLQYIPSINVVTGNSSIVSAKSTVSINNVRPETDVYSLDVNGPVRIKNGDVTMTYDAYNADIGMVAVSPSNPQYAIAIGSPVSFYSGSPAKRNQQIYYTTNGGNKWNTNLAGPANGIDDTFLETSSTYLPIRTAYVVDANLSFFAGKNNLYYSNTSGASWNFISLLGTVFSSSPDITSLYVYKTGAQTGHVYFCIESSNVIGSFQFNASWYSSTTGISVGEAMSFNFAIQSNLINPQFTISGSPSTTTTIFLSGYASSTNFIYRISNVGSIANSLSMTLIDSIITSFRITDIAAYDANTVVAVFDNGAVRSTVNGITNSFFTSASALYGVTLFNNGTSTIGIAVGKNGSIFYSVDTPLSTWTSIPYDVLNSGGNAANIVNPAYDLTSISRAVDTSTCQFYVVQRRAAYVDGTTLGQSRIYHLYLPNLFSNSTNYVLDVSGTQRVSGDIQLNDGGRLTSANNSIGYLFNDAPVSTILIGGSASAITVGNSGNVNALTTIQSKLSVSKDATFQSSMNITGNVRVTTSSNGFMGAIFDNNVTSTGDISIGGLPNSALGLPVTRDPSNNINTQRNIRIGNFTGSGDLSNNIYVGGPLDTVVLGGSVVSSTSYKIGPAIYINFASLPNSSAGTGLFFGETGNTSAGRFTISANGEGFLIRSTKSTNTVLLDTNALTYTGVGALNNAIVTLSKVTGNVDMNHRLSTSSLDVSSVLVRNYAFTAASVVSNAQIVDTPMRILGNVGIGTASSGLLASGFVLDVSGNANVSGRLTVQSGTVSLDSGNSIVLATGPTTYNGAGGYNVCIGFSVMSSVSLTNTAVYNTAIGGYSLQSLTTGDKNVAIGAGAAKAITSGQFNTAIGVDALINTIIGQKNVAVGYFAGKGSSGSNNTFLGADTSGGAFSNSTAIGCGATITSDNQIVLGTAAQTVVIPGGLNASATQTITFGNNAPTMVGTNITGINGNNISTGTVPDGRLSGNVVMLANTQTISGSKTFSSLLIASGGINVTGSIEFAVGSTYSTLVGGGHSSAATNSVLIGYTAGQALNGSSDLNVVIGVNALKVGISSRTVAIGAYALNTYTSNGENISIGAYSALTLLSGTRNILIGNNSGGIFTTGSNNTILGFNAAADANGGCTGSQNTCIGAYSALNMTGTSSNNTFLGMNTGFSTSATYSNSTAIGYNAKITASNQIVLGTSGETVVIPGGLNASATQTITFGNNAPTMVGTNITLLNGNNISTGTVADARLSTNVPKMNVENTFTGNNNLNGNVTVASNLTAPVLIGSATLIALSGSASAEGGNVFGIGNVRVSYTGFSSVGTNVLSLPATNSSAGYYTIVISYSGLVRSGFAILKVQYNDTGDFYALESLPTSTGRTIVQYSAPNLTNGITNAANAFKFAFDQSVSYTFKSMVVSVYYSATSPATSPVLSTNNFQTIINSTLFPNRGLYATAQQVITFGDNAPVMSGANIANASIPIAALAGSVSTAGINSVGNVAINTASSPTANIQLDVIGNLRVTGSLSLSNGSVADSALSGNVVMLANTQIISGSKTFSSRLTVQSGTVSLDSGNNIVLATGPTYNGAGTHNVCIGFSAMSNSSLESSAANNIGLGGYSLQSLTTGEKNVAVGAGAGKAITSGQLNTAIGVDSLIHTITGQNNVAIGYYSGQNSTGSNNTFLGMYTTGGAFSNSTAIGYGATITASNQIVLGTAAQTVIIPGGLNASATQTITFGNNAPIMSGANIANSSIPIAALAGSVNTTGINSTGNVAINQLNSAITPNYQLDVSGNARISGDTAIVGNVSAASFTSSSDRRLKENIVPLVSASKTIANISPVFFDWKETGKRDCGFIAQNVFAELPYMNPLFEDWGVDAHDPITGESVFYKLDYGKMTPHLWAAAQELYRENTQLKTEMRELKSEMREMEERLSRIESVMRMGSIPL